MVERAGAGEVGHSARNAEHRGIVMGVLRAALSAADPYRAVRGALAQIEYVTRHSSIYVLGAGKAGAAMSRAADDALGDRIRGGLVMVKDGHLGDTLPARIELVEAGHPVPDSRGVEATARLIQIAEKAGSDDLVLCLISGGGSALMPAPAGGVTLEDVQLTTHALLRSGATINELNTVRKHVSRIAGGQLARAASPARVVSLILSDVTGSPLDVIASGPTAPDPTTFAEALAIIERYHLLRETPPSVLARLQDGAEGRIADTPKADDSLFAGVHNTIVASNVLAVEAAAREAAQRGLDVLIGSTFVEGDARTVGTMLASVAREICTYGRPVTRPGCVLFGGETTVKVRGEGIGGRNTELALSAAIALQGLGDSLIVASLATDGGDGSSPSAGAIVDGTTIERGTSLGLDAHRVLIANDSYTYLAAVGDAIMLGPTGTNVNDVMAVFVL